MIGWLVDERRIEPHANLIDKSYVRTEPFPAATSPSIQSAIFISVPAAKS